MASTKEECGQEIFHLTFFNLKLCMNKPNFVVLLEELESAWLDSGHNVFFKQDGVEREHGKKDNHNEQVSTCVIERK